MFGQRRICGSSYGGPRYPDEYILFGEYYVARDGAGGFVLGRISLQFGEPAGLQNGAINYDGHQGPLIARYGSQADRTYLATARYNDNPETLVLPSGQQVSYNRIVDTPVEASLDSVYGALRQHFGMINSRWHDSFANHEANTDQVLFLNGHMMDYAYYRAFSSFAVDQIRYTSGSPVNLLNSTKTGHIDTDAARFVSTTSQRIIVEIHVRGAPTYDHNPWIWKVMPFNGPEPDGRYSRRADGTLNPGSLRPTLEVATLEAPYVVLGRFAEAVGNRVSRAAVVGSEAEFLPVPLSQADMYGTLTHDMSTEPPSSTDPIWSLYGGQLRINRHKQFSIKGGPWFTPPSAIFGSFGMSYGDYWARDLAEYPFTYSKGTPSPITPP